eukprot:4013684-Amphidinium_carterae.1
MRCLQPIVIHAREDSWYSARMEQMRVPAVVMAYLTKEPAFSPEQPMIVACTDVFFGCGGGRSKS